MQGLKNRLKACFPLLVYSFEGKNEIRLNCNSIGIFIISYFLTRVASENMLISKFCLNLSAKLKYAKLLKQNYRYAY